MSGGGSLCSLEVSEKQEILRWLPWASKQPGVETIGTCESAAGESEISVSVSFGD